MAKDRTPQSMSPDDPELIKRVDEMMDVNSAKTAPVLPKQSAGAIDIFAAAKSTSPDLLQKIGVAEAVEAPKPEPQPKLEPLEEELPKPEAPIQEAPKSAPVIAIPVRKPVLEKKEEPPVEIEKPLPKPMPHHPRAVAATPVQAPEVVPDLDDVEIDKAVDDIEKHEGDALFEAQDALLRQESLEMRPSKAPLVVGLILLGLIVVGVIAFSALR